MRLRNKILALCALIAIVVLGLGGSAQAEQVESVPCQGTVSGNTATVSGDCILLAYRYADGAPGPDQLATSLPQTLVSSDNTVENGVLTVTVPDCFWQVDLVQAWANVVQTLTTVDHYYSQGALVDSEHGGTTACTTTVTTTTSTSTTVPQTTTSTTVDVCQEDEPCWDCETMGNHVCGTTTTTTPVVTTTTAPPTTQLARTGMKDNLPIIVFGLAVAGMGCIILSESLKREHS